MDPVRLALDVGPLQGHRTGIGLAVAELAAALERHPGVEVTPYVLSFRSRPEPPVRRLPLPAAAAHRLWSRLDRPRLDRWLGDTEVVHGTNYVVPPSRRPRVVSVYDTWFLAHPERASPAVHRAGEVLRRSVRGGAMIHASSTATADAARQLLGTERVEVVLLAPLPVAPAADAAAVDLGLGGAPFVLALGTLERRKNVPHLVRAFDRAGLADVHLVLAGADGDDGPGVRAAVDALPGEVRRRVHVLGPVDDATKAWLLCNATLLAYPSLDEGFGFPVLEAQQARLPVVATRAGSIPEVAGAGADLVALDDVDALADAIVQVVSDDGRRAELIVAGTANLGRFSWTATADALVDLYVRLREAA